MPKKRSALTLDDIDKLESSQEVAEIVDIRLSPEGLREVELILGKRKIVVSEADALSEYRFYQGTNLLIEKPLPDEFVNTVAINIYPPLYACSSGDMPSPEEFIKLGKFTQKLWIQTARKLNPHEKIDGQSWWLFLEEMEKSPELLDPKLADEDEVEKKG